MFHISVAVLVVEHLDLDIAVTIVRGRHAVYGALIKLVTRHRYDSRARGVKGWCNFIQHCNELLT